MMDTPAFLADAPVWPLALLGLFAFLLGLLIGRIRKGRPEPPRRTITTEAGAFVDLEVYRESQKAKARLEQENQAFSELFLLLTDFVKEMDGRLDRSALPQRMRELVDKVFLPSQILIFIADSNKPDTLILKDTKGLPVKTVSRREVKIGEGKIGWVAQHHTPMDQEDFVREMRNAGVSRDSKEDFRFQVDLCAPMLGKSRAAKGVISVGGITRHLKFEKRLLSMIADMGAVALANRDLMDDSVEKANSDGLTGLFNKRYLQIRLGEEIHKAETARRPLSLFIFDLDHFKKLNDSHGHLTGDKVLKETAQILKTECMRRGEDVAARWGGEEFLVILPGTPKEGAAKFAEKVRQALEKHSFTNEDGVPIGAVTLSGGIASFPEDGRQQSELVGMADEALYASKKSGRNRITKAQPKLMSAADEEPFPGGTDRAASGM